MLITVVYCIFPVILSWFLSIKITFYISKSIFLQGSDIETAVSENGGTTSNHEFASEEYITLQEEEEQPLDSSSKILKPEPFYKICGYSVIATKPITLPVFVSLK